MNEKRVIEIRLSSGTILKIIVIGSLLNVSAGVLTAYLKDLDIRRRLRETLQKLREEEEKKS